MAALPSVRARLTERFLFNFRLPLRALAELLPVSWLDPQPVGGYGVVSFCLLDLRNITVAPLPAVAGFTSVSCAPRYAVLDRSGGGSTPAVFVTERQTGSAFGAWFTSLGFSAPHPYIEAVVRRDRGETALGVHDPDRGGLFSASVRAAESTTSELFASPESFAAFIAEGVTGYGLSRHDGRLTKMDLHKRDGTYEPLAVSDLSGTIVDGWRAVGGVFDSAFRTGGGTYEWTYYGLVDSSTGRAA